MNLSHRRSERSRCDRSLARRRFGSDNLVDSAKRRRPSTSDTPLQTSEGRESGSGPCHEAGDLTLQHQHIEAVEEDPVSLGDEQSALIGGQRDPTERHPFRGGCLFDGDHGVDEDGRIESAVDAKRGTQVKLRPTARSIPGTSRMASMCSTASAVSMSRQQVT